MLLVVFSVSSERGSGRNYTGAGTDTTWGRMRKRRTRHTEYITKRSEHREQQQDNTSADNGERTKPYTM